MDHATVRAATSPVAIPPRRTVTSQYTGSSSIAKNLRPARSAAMIWVPIKHLAWWTPDAPQNSTVKGAEKFADAVPERGVGSG